MKTLTTIIIRDVAPTTKEVHTIKPNKVGNKGSSSSLDFPIKKPRVRQIKGHTLIKNQIAAFILYIVYCMLMNLSNLLSYDGQVNLSYFQVYRHYKLMMITNAITTSKAIVNVRGSDISLIF